MIVIRTWRASVVQMRQSTACAGTNAVRMVGWPDPLAWRRQDGQKEGRQGGYGW